jgi:hypothetical protein
MLRYLSTNGLVGTTTDRQALSRAYLHGLDVKSTVPAQLMGKGQAEATADCLASLMRLLLGPLGGNSQTGSKALRSIVYLRTIRERFVG